MVYKVTAVTYSRANITAYFCTCSKLSKIQNFKIQLRYFKILQSEGWCSLFKLCRNSEAGEIYLGGGGDCTLEYLITALQTLNKLDVLVASK